MEAFDYINFLNLDGSLMGLLALSLFFVVIAIVRPYLAIAMLCIYTEFPWSASFKPLLTVYPIYPLAAVLLLRYARQIADALSKRRYNIAVVFAFIIALWAALSPLFYPVRDGIPITFTQNPVMHRALQTIAILVLLPAVLCTRDDINRLIRSIFFLLMSVHVIVLIFAFFFVFSGYPLSDLHKMRILNTPPVYWESGLLLICLVYFFILRKGSSLRLICFSILACFGLIVGNSRARFVASMLCILYFIRPYLSVRIFAGIVAFLFFIFVSVIAMPERTKDYLLKLVVKRVEQSTKGNLDKISNSRIEQYKAAINQWEKSPLIGVGSGYTMPPIRMIGTTKPIRVRIHNHFLEVLTAQGIVGFILLITILISTLKKTLIITKEKADKEIDGRLIIALFIYGIINWLFKESWGTTYATIAMIGAYKQVIND
ncbi:MAG: O-antigen ligase family protein [Pseudomonadota bacterium]